MKKSIALLYILFWISFIGTLCCIDQGIEFGSFVFGMGVGFSVTRLMLTAKNLAEEVEDKKDVRFYS
jgi:hypothetical protein